MRAGGIVAGPSRVSPALRGMENTLERGGVGGRAEQQAQPDRAVDGSSASAGRGELGRAGTPLGPPPGDPPGPPGVPATAVPVPAVGLAAADRPGHHMRHPRHDLVVTARTAVALHRTCPRHRTDDVLVPVRPRFRPAVDITESATDPRRLHAGARTARISSWHDPKSRRDGIRCSRSHVGRRNPGSGSGSRDPRPTCAPGA